MQTLYSIVFIIWPDRWLFDTAAPPPLVISWQRCGLLTGTKGESYSFSQFLKLWTVALGALWVWLQCSSSQEEPLFGEPCCLLADACISWALPHLCIWSFLRFVSGNSCKWLSCDWVWESPEQFMTVLPCWNHWLTPTRKNLFSLWTNIDWLQRLDP
jgi:hypothetical protein